MRVGPPWEGLVQLVRQIGVSRHTLCCMWSVFARMDLAASGHKGEIAMKRLCYLMWLAGMAGLVAYGFSDSILDQAAVAVELMGQVVASVAI